MIFNHQKVEIAIKPGLVEVVGEITSKTDDAVLFHDGGPGAWLPLAEIVIFYGDPIPGVVTVWMPAAMALEHGFLDEVEAA